MLLKKWLTQQFKGRKIAVSKLGEIVEKQNDRGSIVYLDEGSFRSRLIYKRRFKLVETALPIYHKIVSGYLALISISCNDFFVVIAASMSCDFSITYSLSSNINRRANDAN